MLLSVCVLLPLLLFAFAQPTLPLIYLVRLAFLLLTTRVRLLRLPIFHVQPSLPILSVEGLLLVLVQLSL